MPGSPGKRSFVTLAQSYAGSPESIGQESASRRAAGRIAAARRMLTLGRQPGWKPSSIRAPAWPRLRGRLAGEYGAKFVHIGAPGRLRPVDRRDCLSLRTQIACPAVGRRANPQIVHSPDVPSVRAENRSDTGITNDERGNGTGGNGSCPLTSPCTPATTSPTSPPARAAAAAPGPCRTTPPPGNRQGSGPGRAPRRSG